MCEYCEYSEPIKTDTEHIELSVFVDEITVHFDGQFEQCNGYAKINYCPQCGRPLTEPKPLSLDELKAREGKPVWIVPLNDDNENPHWHLVNTVPSTYGEDSEVRDSVDYTKEFKDYNKTWQAFDHEPKEV